MWTIRPLRDGDGADLMRLHGRAILAISPGIYTLDELQSWAFGLRADQYRPPDGGHFEVVEIGGAIVAFRDHTNDEVLGLYVDPVWQGHGIGAELMGLAEARMVASGSARAKVHASLPALPFYERLGYRVVQRTEHRSRGGLVMASARMEKDLEAPSSSNTDARPSTGRPGGTI